MNKLILFFAAIVLLVFTPVSHAFAQESDAVESSQNGVPSDSSVSTNDESYAAQNDAADEYNRSQVRVSSSSSRADAAGWSSVLGIGFASKQGMNVSLSGGYKFGKYFGLYADIAAKFGFGDMLSASTTPVFASDIAIVPKFQIGGQTCLFSIGLGLGYYYYMNTEDSDTYQNQVHTYVTNAFLIKPEIDLDFVFESGFIFGFGIDVPVYLGLQDETIEREYSLNFPTGTVLSKKKKFEGETGKFVKGARFDILVHLGYKF